MTELGVYILGSTALVLLAAAGISAGSSEAVGAAVIASGAAYLSQLFAALVSQGRGGTLARAINLGVMLIALVTWSYGVISLFA